MAESDIKAAEIGTGSEEATRKQDVIKDDWLAELELAEAVAKAAKAASSSTTAPCNTPTPRVSFAGQTALFGITY